MGADTRYITRTQWKSLPATDLTYPSSGKLTNEYDALYRRVGGASIPAWQFYGSRTATVALGNGVTCSMMTAVGGSGSNAWTTAGTYA